MHQFQHGDVPPIVIVISYPAALLWLLVPHGDGSLDLPLWDRWEPCEYMLVLITKVEMASFRTPGWNGPCQLDIGYHVFDFHMDLVGMEISLKAIGADADITAKICVKLHEYAQEILRCTHGDKT
jgi:hypothetical protein